MKKSILFSVFVYLLLVAPMNAQTHSATLKWTASTDAAANPSLAYNVYRLIGSCPAVVPATVAGAVGFQKINSAPITLLTYTDNGFPLPPLPPGLYCYFATSTLGGAESNPSNLIQTVILPGPPLNLTGSIT